MPFVYIGIKPENLHQGLIAMAIDASYCWTLFCIVIFSEILLKFKLGLIRDLGKKKFHFFFSQLVPENVSKHKAMCTWLYYS